MLAPALAGIVLVGFHPAPAARGGAAARGVEAAFATRRGGFPALDAGEPRRRPFLSQRIPEDQEPVVQLQVLSGAPFYDWAATDAYGDRIVGLYQGTMVFLSLPISLVTFNVLPAELPQLLLAANMGTCAFLLAFVARLRVGWGAVAKRLKETNTYFEAGGFANFLRKDRETSLRDKLLAQRQVAPALKRIDASLVVVAAALASSLLLGEAVTAIEGESGPATLKTLSGDAAIDYNNRLRFDNEFAAREQARARRKANRDGPGGVKPVYCDSRYYKILAGGNGQGGVGCGDGD